MNSDFILLFIRLLLGITLALHGAQKVFGLFGGSGLSKWNEYISSQNIPFTNVKFPTSIATISAFTELFIGLFLLVGIFTKISAVISIIFLLFAILIAHKGKGYFIQSGGWEYALNLIILSIILVLAGGGKYSLTKGKFN
jgi:putative oxidoreductase